MGGVYQQYTEELHDKFGYLATWLPGTKLKLGDVGILKRDRFEFVTTLNDLGLPFTIRDISGAADYQYVSAKGANIGFHADAAAPAIPGSPMQPASTKVSVVFTRANAVVFVAAGCKTTLIEQQDALGRRILELYKSGDWPKNHGVITELVTAGSATILISASDSAQVDLSAKAGIAPAGLTLADTSAEFQIASSTGVATQILVASQLTPLFRASAVHRHIFSSPGFDSRGTDSVRRREPEEDVFADIDYSDLE